MVCWQYSSTIEEWDLSSNPIGNDGLKVFLQVHQPCTSHLIEDAESMDTQGFLVNRVVTVLAIRDTMLEDDGCTASLAHRIFTCAPADATC